MRAPAPNRSFGPRLDGLSAGPGCITAGVATTAAARKTELTAIESTVSGVLDVRGVLGIDEAIRNGFSEIHLSIHVEGDADAETLRALVAASRARSAVYDVLRNETFVVIDVST